MENDFLKCVGTLFIDISLIFLVFHNFPYLNWFTQCYYLQIIQRIEVSHSLLYGKIQSHKANRFKSWFDLLQVECTWCFSSVLLTFIACCEHCHSTAFI